MAVAEISGPCATLAGQSAEMLIPPPLKSSVPVVFASPVKASSFTWRPPTVPASVALSAAVALATVRVGALFWISLLKSLLAFLAVNGLADCAAWLPARALPQKAATSAARATAAQGEMRKRSSNKA